MLPKKYGYTYDDVTIPYNPYDAILAVDRDLANEPSPFEKWNRDSNNLIKNCFVFVCNAIEPEATSLLPGDYRVGIPEPGFMGGKPFAGLHVDGIREALMFDGFRYITYEKQEQVIVPPDYYLVAGFVHPKKDYHFYRRYEETGIWYHKPGWKHIVSNRDSHNDIITDPIKAARGNGDYKYDQFVGFFLMHYDGLKLTFDILAEDELNPRRPGIDFKTGLDMATAWGLSHMRGFFSKAHMQLRPK